LKRNLYSDLKRWTKATIEYVTPPKASEFETLVNTIKENVNHNPSVGYGLNTLGFMTGLDPRGLWVRPAVNAISLTVDKYDVVYRHPVKGKDILLFDATGVDKLIEKLQDIASDKSQKQRIKQAVEEGV
jgi:hypothetical protein